MTPSLRGYVRTCKTFLRLRCFYSTSSRRVTRLPAPCGNKAAASARRLIGARVSGLRDLPTSNTILPLTRNKPGTQLDDGFIAPPPEEWANYANLMAGCEPGKRLHVAVLISGGVDSSLALRLLQAAGHTCRAFYLQIWFQEDFRNFWDACPWEDDLEYARKVCASLDVPLEVVPLTTEYWDRVVAASVAEIREGRTPNPDMWCNSRVKFGAFYDYLDLVYGSQFDRVASGHYARVERVAKEATRQQMAMATSATGAGARDMVVTEVRGPQQGLGAVAVGLPSGAAREEGEDDERRRSHDFASSSSTSRLGPGPASGLVSSGSVCGEAGEEEEEVRLLLTPDAVKDQTYFLANLSPRQLARVMFPLGYLTKPEVRKLAAAANLANKDRKDSQGICFLGKVKFPEFVREHLGEWPGPILEAETGTPLGLHRGYWFYTVGQRGGIKLPGGPWYVVAKDTQRNAVLVSRQYYDTSKQRNAFTCGPFNWLHPTDRPDPRGGRLHVKVRHGPNMYACSLRLHDAEGNSAMGEDSYGTVVLEQNDQGLAAGQYAVLYQDNRCLGCAVIRGTVDAAMVGKR